MSYRLKKETERKRRQNPIGFKKDNTYILLYSLSITHARTHTDTHTFSLQFRGHMKQIFGSNITAYEHICFKQTRTDLFFISEVINTKYLEKLAICFCF